MAASSVGVLIPGGLIAGFGIGFVSAVIILYMSEVAPKRFRGAIVSGYQFCITIGLLLASVVDNGTKDRMDSSAYRIPIGLQWLFATVLGVGLFLLPESPRWYVKKGRHEDAAHCFRGGWKPSSNLRRVVLGMALQMMQQWTGVNFGK